MTNFHNISSLTYDIEDNKINFLYGVSGSGKSSIVKAITQGTIEESDIMVGCNQHDATPVLINGATGPLASTVVFNEDRQTILFSRRPEKVSTTYSLATKKKSISFVQNIRMPLQLCRQKSAISAASRVR